MPLKVNFSL